MKLLALQRTMARAVMQPLTKSEHMQEKAPGGGKMRAYASRFIKPNDRLTSFERLEIYNRQYWFRLLSALSEDFPGLRSVLGEKQFDAMCKAYRRLPIRFVHASQPRLEDGIVVARPSQVGREEPDPRARHR